MPGLEIFSRYLENECESVGMLEQQNTLGHPVVQFGSVWRPLFQFQFPVAHHQLPCLVLFIGRSAF